MHHLGLVQQGIPSVDGDLHQTRWRSPTGHPEFRFVALQHGGHRWPSNLGEPGRSTAETLVAFFQSQIEP